MKLNLPTILSNNDWDANICEPAEPGMISVFLDIRNPKINNVPSGKLT
jgi:hypothetical protein